MPTTSRTRNVLIALAAATLVAGCGLFEGLVAEETFKLNLKVKKP